LTPKPATTSLGKRCSINFSISANKWCSSTHTRDIA
jgi:hypothetical protein